MTKQAERELSGAAEAEAMAVVVDPTRGWTVADMHRAFEQVRPVGHWKDAIHAVIPADDFDLVAAAVEFYTATKLRVRSTYRHTSGQRRMLVEADGYHAGPAGSW